jgi:hypothetical protein
MAEYDSSITAHIGGDYSGLSAAITGAEGEVKALDGKFAELGKNINQIPQEFAEQNKKAMAQLQTGEERLAEYREKTAFSRMTDEQKLAVLRSQGMSLLGKINSIEGETVEKVALRLQLEKKKTEIYDLNESVQQKGLATQRESTAETADHTKKATGLHGVVESLKKGFKDMGISLQGAGIGVALAGFVSLGKQAIDQAQQQRAEWEKIGKPIDAATRSIAMFGDSIDTIKKGAITSVGFILSGWTQIGEVIGSSINRLLGVTEAQENIAAATEKGVEAAVKRRDAILAEKMDVEKIHAAQQAMNAAQKDYADSKKNAQDKHNALLADEIALIGKINVHKAAGLNPIALEKELLEKKRAVYESTIALIELEAGKRIAAIQAAGQLDITMGEKSKTILKERAELEDEYRKMVEQTTATSEHSQKVLVAIEANKTAELKLQREYQSSIKLEGAEYETLLKLQLKGLNRLTDEEKFQLQILQLKTREKGIEKQIEDAIAAIRVKAPADVTQKEKDVLRELERQKEVVEKLIAAKMTEADAAKNVQLPAEEALTTEAEKRLAVEKKIVETKNGGLAGYSSAFSGGQTQPQNMSTTMLQGLVAKQDAILNAVDSTGRQVKDATLAHGDYYAKYAAESLRTSYQSELNLRKEIQDYGKRMGDVAAVMKYGDAQTSRAFNGFVSVAEQTNTMLQKISQQLTSSGIFKPSGINGT